MNEKKTFKNLLNPLFNSEFGRDLLVRLKNINVDTVCPDPKYIFRPYSGEFVTPDTVKVVIFFEEVIADRNIADGFGASSLDPKIRHRDQGKLLNMLYNSLYPYMNAEQFKNLNSSTSVIPWVKKGILPINMRMTTQNGIPGAHRGNFDWVEVSGHMVRELSRYRDNPERPLLFIFIGEAKKLMSYIQLAHHNYLTIDELTGIYNSAVFNEKNFFKLISQFFINFYPQECDYRELSIQEAIDKDKVLKLYQNNVVKQLLPYDDTMPGVIASQFDPKMKINLGPDLILR